MTGSILNFPTASTQPPQPPYVRPTLAEVAFHRARFGLHLCDATAPSPQPANSTLNLLDQATLAATRIELAIASHTARERTRRLFDVA